LATETLAKEAKKNTLENNPINKSEKKSNNQVKISICDVMKDNTSKRIKKIGISNSIIFPRVF